MTTSTRPFRDCEQQLVFGQHLLNAGPPIKIERVDVPVRLEKRLAARRHGVDYDSHGSYRFVEE